MEISMISGDNPLGMSRVWFRLALQVNYLRTHLQATVP